MVSSSSVGNGWLSGISPCFFTSNDRGLIPGSLTRKYEPELISINSSSVISAYLFGRHAKHLSISIFRHSPCFDSILVALRIRIGVFTGNSEHAAYDKMFFLLKEFIRLDIPLYCLSGLKLLRIGKMSFNL